MATVLRSFKVEQELWRKFDEECQRLKTSKSAVIRLLIKMFVDDSR